MSASNNNKDKKPSSIPDFASISNADAPNISPPVISRAASPTVSSMKNPGHLSPKFKGPQRVRFPVDNDAGTRMVHLPRDDYNTVHDDVSQLAKSEPSSSSAGLKDNNAPGTSSPGGYFNIVPTKRVFRSPLNTPPINIEHYDGSRTSYIPESDSDDERFSEYEYINKTTSGDSSINRGYDSRPPLSRNSSSQQLLTIHDYDEGETLDNEDGDIATKSMLAAATSDNGGFGTGLFDLGGITPGGLAPGTVSNNDNRIKEKYQPINDLESQNVGSHSDQEAKLTSRNTELNSGPYGNGREGNDILLEEVNRKLGELHVDEASQDFADKLVRSHSRYRGSRAPSPDHQLLTVPTEHYFNDPNNDQSTLTDDMTHSEDVHRDGTITPKHEDYVPPPQKVRRGVLGSLLKLYEGQDQHRTEPNTGDHSQVPSGASTPKGAIESPPPAFPSKHSHTKSLTDLSSLRSKAMRWHKTKGNSGSTTSLTELASLSSSRRPSSETPPKDGPKKPSRPKPYRRTSGLEVLKAKKEKEKKKREDERRRVEIAVHIAEVLQRQRFILRLCRALMLFGAPTHRLEEYMKMTSRVLAIDGQFLYIPGCMVISFGDSSTHTSEMQLVKCVQGVNLYKLHETHTIYKDVIHGNLTVDEASIKLEEQFSSKNLYNEWFCVLFFAFACLAVGPFAFGARWLDMPISFLLGGSVGMLQIVVAPRSSLYNNVFEVTASIVVSFLGRAFGSIGNQQDYFCFAAIAQSSLALILPGYIILCGSLELQSRNIVAGAVRMFYAIIYSLFLGFGITLGAAAYGWMDTNATSVTVCPNTLNPWWRFLFVPMFTLGLALVNQAHWRQIPPMLIISGCGYVVTYFSGRKLANAAELTSALGALVIGVLGNIYSRVGHGLAFAAMLPAIFVQVPSGVASQGSLIAGIDNANSIVSNGTEQSSSSNDSTSYGNVAALGVTMVQVSIGITVGLFVATLVIYPFGKKRSGLFTF